METSLKQEFDYYVQHHAELVEKYDGKVIVIKNCTIIGSFADELEAIEEVSKKYELGTFLVQKCEPGEQNYSATFHSRVSFA